MNSFFKNRIILITGGTGSFGNAMTKKLLKMSPKIKYLVETKETR